MTHVILWVVIGTAYLLSMILICKCVSHSDKKYVEVGIPTGPRTDNNAQTKS